MCCEAETKSTTTSSLPEWLSQAGQSAVGRAESLADKPFESYTGERVAGFSQDQSDAFQKLRQLLAGAPKVGEAALTGAATYGSAPAQSITAQSVAPDTVKANLGDISAYFNPNTEAALQPALRKIQEQADATRKQVNAGATSAHAFGDARHGIVESGVDKNTQIAVGDTSAKAYQDMYDKALAALSGDVNTRNAGKVANAQFGQQAELANAGFDEQALTRLLTGSNALQSIAQSDQNLQLQQLQALLGTGALQQGNAQAGDDAAFQEFLRAYGDDFAKLSALSSTIKGVPHDTTQSTVSTQDDNSGLGAIGSIAGAAAGSKGFWSWLSGL